MHAIQYIMLPRQVAQFAADWATPVFQRMGLDHQMMVTRRACGKACYYFRQETAHAVKGRMHLKRTIMF